MFLHVLGQPAVYSIFSFGGSLLSDIVSHNALVQKPRHQKLGSGNWPNAMAAFWA